MSVAISGKYLLRKKIIRWKIFFLSTYFFVSEMTDGLHQLELNQHQVMQTMPSPDHLVNRKDLLERMGIHPGAPTSSQKTRSHSTNRY